MDAALKGLTVVEYGEGRAIAIAGRLLAELGANVIKIEEPSGHSLRRFLPLHSDGTSYAWHSTCAGKLGLVVDANKAEDIALLNGLIGAACPSSGFSGQLSV